ncbi:MAG: ribosome biogenesis GTPase Der [Clostridia bacterium]|nr:ribosome biogenesis GTPase Der [Clostridia bacterium]
MAKPIVAIVGRPNVGKSAFFNFIAGQRISIVEDTPGVTRDRIYATTDWRGREFTIIDTGGIEPNSTDEILQQMHVQAQIAIDTADVIIFLVNIKDGMTAADKDVADILYRSGKNVVVAVNKVDQVGEPPNDFYEFYNLGLGEIYPISSLHGLGIGNLLDEVYKYFPEQVEEIEDENIIKVAIIGKPNSGKSSLLNKILGEDRVIVSDVPGTTRDAIDTQVTRNDRNYIFIDTAGVRKKSKVYSSIEKYSVLRSWTAVERADVCLLLIDAIDGVTEQDTKIAGYAHEQGKAIITVINKWDLIEKDNSTYKKLTEEAKNKFMFMSYAPVTAISAKTGQRVEELFALINEVYDSYTKRVSTGTLNDVLNDALAMVQPPTHKGRSLKIYYMTQVSVKPPTFVLFINTKKLFHFSYERYLFNQLREAFGFVGTPIRFIVKEKDKEKER